MKNTLTILCSVATLMSIQAGESSVVQCMVEKDRVKVTVDRIPFFTYFMETSEVFRPFITDLHSPSGIRVTRSFPPIVGKDRVDHPTMHPGVWMAFGDISKHDFWRNLKGRVVRASLDGEPSLKLNEASLTVQCRYEVDGKRLLSETVRYSVLRRPTGNLLIIDSTYSAVDGEVVFGDQEEMGLGVRLRKELCTDDGGKMLDADGRVGPNKIRGQSADWCQASGTVDGKTVSVTVMSDPTNFRRSWWHVRGYGLIVANPFGKAALTGSKEESRVVVRPGEPLRLRFGVLTSDGQPDLKAAFADFVEQLGGRK